MAKTPSQDFLLPQPHEKLAAKFILDALEKKRRVEAQQELAVEAEAEADSQEITASAEPVAEATSQTKAPAAEPQGEAAPSQPAQSYNDIVLDKKYFRIGEAADLLGVEPYVLRYWESEFNGIRPMKTKSGHRTYSKKDVEKFIEIRQLLYVEKFSVKGAKKQMARRKKESPSVPPQVVARHKDSLKEVIHELKGLIQLARGNPGL